MLQYTSGGLRVSDGNRRHQARRLDPQGDGEALDRIDPHGALAALDEADVRAVEPGVEGQPLLGEAEAFPLNAEPVSVGECFPGDLLPRSVGATIRYDGCRCFQK